MRVEIAPIIAISEEFVAAGDFLTYKFPVWSWCVRQFIFTASVLIETFREKGEASKAKDYLPAEKQYLVTRGGMSGKPFFLNQS